MKRWLSICVVFLLVAVWFWLNRSVSPVSDAPVSPYRVVPVTVPALGPSIVGGHYGGLEVGQADTSLDRFVAKLDPATLERLQEHSGSVTNGRSFSVRSEWIPGLSHIPSTSLKIWENPETGSYEFRGVGVEFHMGLGLGYEEEPGSDETRAYFHYKKSF